ncbi:unnamed protein product [Alternaria alternata]
MPSNSTSTIDRSKKSIDSPPSAPKKGKDTGRSRSRLSIPSLSQKWLWSKNSPTAINSGSTPGTDWKFNVKREAESEAMVGTPTRLSSNLHQVLTVDTQSKESIDTATTSQQTEFLRDTTHLESERGSHHSDTVAISDVALSIAIDYSGSTRGKVLEEEKAAIRSISKLLSQESQKRLLILPWNHEADPIISLEEMDEIFSNGGTDPTALLRDRHHREALLSCDLWMLITDGEIDNYLVQDFATRLGGAGLHGTASIVICVGRCGHSPAACNISVGKSVFATVPDCMFLYHDIQAHDVYILQCKGRFKDLLSQSDEHESQVILDYDTKWSDLPQISYDALRQFQVPQKRKVSPDTVILTSGNTFDLNDIYNDTLSDSLTNEIFSNDDDLKTLLLTASTRGRKADVKRWIKNKKLRTSDALWVPRKDIEQRALRSMEKIVVAMKSSTTDDVSTWRDELRLAHEANWLAFASTIATEKNEAKIRKVSITDATARLAMDDRKPSSPVNLAPVSPGASSMRNEIRRNRHVSSSKLGRREAYDPSYAASSGRPLPPRHYQSQPHPSVLFSQGYRFLRSKEGHYSTHSEALEAVCTLCGRDGQVMALVLTQPEYDEPTPNYPELQSHAKHKYPFVLGNFPEVDIVSPELHCETCSVYLVHYGQSPKSDNVLGALPLVQTYGRDHNINLQPWKDTLTKAFGGRFHEDIVLSVFISVLYNTLDDLASVDSSENTLLIRAIRWTCLNLVQSLIVSSDTAATPLGQSPPSVDNTTDVTSFQPLGETVQRLINSALHGHGLLLSYPLDGFLVLMFVAQDIDHEDCTRESLRCVVWLRLLKYMTEVHYESIRRGGDDTVNSNLHHILQTQDAMDVEQDQGSALKRTPLAALSGTYILPEGDLETFQRLGALFSHIETKCGPAMAVFLHHLIEYSSRCDTAAHCFDSMRKGSGLRKLFVGPEDICISKASDLIARMQTEE